MKKPKIIDFKSAKKQLINHGTACMLIIGGSTVVHFGYDFLVNAFDRDQAQHIESLIAAGDQNVESELATTVLAHPYTERLAFVQERYGSTTPFNAAIDEGKVEDASHILQSIDQNLFTAREMHEMEQRLEGITEAGLYRRVHRASGDEQSALCERYLSLYPEGEHRSEIAATYITGEVNLLSLELQTSTRFDEVYSRVQRLNQIVDDLHNDSIILPGYLQGRIATEVVESYLSNAYTIDTTGEFEADRVIDLNLSAIETNSWIDNNLETFLTYRGEARSGPASSIRARFPVAGGYSDVKVGTRALILLRPTTSEENSELVTNMQSLRSGLANYTQNEHN